MASHSVLGHALNCVVGALETTSDDTGITFHRSVGSDRARLGDLGFDFMSAVPSGVRIEAVTDASYFEIDVDLVHPVFDGMTVVSSSFDLVVDGHLREPFQVEDETLVVIDPASGAVEVRPSGPASVRFTIGDDSSERLIEIWFPASSSLKLRDVRVPESASLVPAASQRGIWIHHGSSISQCSEATRPTGTWPALVARATGKSLLNLGIGGQCQLDHFVARAIRDSPAELISLELGINVVNADSMRERVFVSAFHGFLDTVREGHPTTPLTVISPIYCPAAEDHPGPTEFGSDMRTRTVSRPAELRAGALTLSQIRRLLHEHVDRRRAEGDRQLNIINGLDLFGPDSVSLLPDGLHPDAEGYQLIAERFAFLAFDTAQRHGSRS